MEEYHKKDEKDEFDLGIDEDKKTSSHTDHSHSGHSHDSDHSGHSHSGHSHTHKHSDHSHSGHSHDSHGGGFQHDSGDDTIKISKDSLWKYSTFVLIAVIIVGAFFVFGNNGGGSGATGNVVANPTPAPTQPPTGARVEVSVDDDAVKGDPDAPVTIIEFSDYECPFCARFYTQTLDQIQKEYIDTGKAKLVYRDFPLSFHPQAQKAAEAAECAGEQDKYFEMHDKLFEQGVTGGVTSFKQYAGELGLNQKDFDSCLDSGEMAAEVQKDFQDGQQYGVRGTPGFFVNGKLISGAQPFSAFQQAIDAELA